MSQLFEFFGDDDVLDMLAIADQRIERWFVPFWRVASTAHLTP